MSIEPRKIMGIATVLNSKMDPSKKKMEVEPQSIDIFNEYLKEITAAIIEEASFLAKSKHSTTIEDSDINFILGKKLGISVPGLKKPIFHDKNALKYHKIEDPDIKDEESTSAAGTTTTTTTTTTAVASSSSSSNSSSTNINAIATVAGGGASSTSSSGEKETKKSSGVKRKSSDNPNSDNNISNNNKAQKTSSTTATSSSSNNNPS